MSAGPDYAALVTGLHALLERVNAGDSGLPAVHQLLGIAGDALGAAGMTMTELVPAGGRVVAATGAMAWAAGRPMPTVCQPGDLDPGGDRTWETPVTALPERLARQLARRGLRSLLGARVERAGQLLGELHAYFPDRAGSPAPAHHAMVGFVGTVAASLCPHPADRAAEPAVPFDKDLFIAVTSHELRTPVTVIKGFVDTLDQHWDVLDESGRREAVRVIGHRADELACMVNRLFAAATATDPVGRPLCAPFNLVDALRDITAALRCPLRDRLRLTLPAHLPLVYGDRRSLPTVLTELITNATKYSNDQIELRAGADDHTVFFQVADWGIGIAPEHVEQAFVRFWQADLGSQQEATGAGLGLHLVRQIVERQHGWVSLRPRRRGGTVAEVRLPRADTVDPDRS